MTTNRLLTRSLRTLCCVAALTTGSAWAALVPWDLSHNATDAAAVSNFTGPSDYSTTVHEYDSSSVSDTSHQLSFKKGPESSGSSDLVKRLDSEQPSTESTPSDYIQLDLHSINGGHTKGETAVASAQANEALLVFGSNTQGTLESKIEADYSSFDDQFVSTPGNYEFTSVTTGGKDALPVAVRSAITAVPEMSALFPIVGLIAAVSCTQILRRRRAAQKTASIS